MKEKLQGSTVSFQFELLVIYKLVAEAIGVKIVLLLFFSELFILWKVSFKASNPNVVLSDKFFLSWRQKMV